MSTWISVDKELPYTYGMYDSYGNDLKVSDIVVTNVGAGCYCSESDIYKAPLWIEVDWCHKSAGTPLKGVTLWALLPELPKELL
tara:strand:+ start:254 stop:505 length:252 start_codon:yes stop_codon:yes gene_type:complete